MRVKTALERALEAHPNYALTQEFLDRDGVAVCSTLEPEVFLEHNRIVYEDTSAIYANNPEHSNVSDALCEFIGRLNDGSRILDVGCGPGRDAVFLSLEDTVIRARFMGRRKNGKTALERYEVPTKSFSVLGIDASKAMIGSAIAYAKSIGCPEGEGSRLNFRASSIDMHSLSSQDLGGSFDGVWSSAALFMHTPKALISTALRGVAQVLRENGLLGVSYANVTVDTPYDNLRLSRTGEIKYFSRPSPELISALANREGLLLLSQSFSDLEMGGKIQKDFFVTQFFEKI